MPGRPNPFALSVTGSINLRDGFLSERDVVSQIVQRGLAVDNERTSWFERQRALTKLRFGIRPNIKTFPWRGCSNVSIALIDKVIRKWKPPMMRLFVEPDPVVEFQGKDPEAVERERQAEEVYNWLWKIKMDAIEVMAYALDIMAHRGKCFVQAGWDYRTELECRTVPVAQVFPQGVPPDPQAIAQTLIQHYDIDVNQRKVKARLDRAVQQIQGGATFVKIAFRKVVRDRPAVWERDPVQVIMPSRTTHVEDAEWIVVQHIVSLRQVQRMEADGFFEEGFAKKVGEDLTRSRQIRDGTRGSGESANTIYEQYRQLEDDRERIWGSEDEDNVLLWQVYHWKDIDDDGLDDRVETWLHPRSLTKGACKPYAYPFHAWPFVAFDFEKVNRRWHSPRGISQMLEGFQRVTNAQHNARLDGMTLRNAPTYQTQVLSGFKARNWRVVPGTVLTLPAGSRLEPLQQDRGPFGEQVTEENFMRSLAEDYVGTFDTALSSMQDASKGRTATEVQAATQFAAATANMDAMVFQIAMRKLHTMVWKLFLDLGEDEVFVKIIGDDNAAPVGQQIRKADIAREYELVPTGTIANTNRALEIAHAREALQLYLNDQSGFINPFEMRRWHLNLLDYRWARRILNSPEQAQELQTLRSAAAELQNNPDLQAALTGGVSDVPIDEAEKQRVEFLPRDTQGFGG